MITQKVVAEKSAQVSLLVGLEASSNISEIAIMVC
jgi:hypothetical protein